MKATKSYRAESDSLGTVQIPNDRLWGPQTQRCLEHFSIGKERMPGELISSYAILKKAAAQVNYIQGRLSQEKATAIETVCDEILEGQLEEHFPLHVWMSGSGTQFNMNMNEVIANRCSQRAGTPLGSKAPIHPNDDANCSQSSNDTFPTAMNIAAAIAVHQHLLPNLRVLYQGLLEKEQAWEAIVKLGRTHLQDATPLTLGQQFSGYRILLQTHIESIEYSLKQIYEIPMGGTAVGTGLNTLDGFDRLCAAKIAAITHLPFITAPNKFAAQGSHSGMVQLSGALKNLAVSLYKICNDIRLLSCGPRSGFYELLLPSNEPGSSIMPGKVNPTQCEALTMIATQVISNDVAVSLADASGYLEMNVYKPVMIYNLLQSITLLSDGCRNFEKFLLRDTQPNRKKIEKHLSDSLMLVTALTPLIGYEKAAELAHYAVEQDLSLEEAALRLNLVSKQEFAKRIQPLQMCYPQKRSPE